MKVTVDRDLCIGSGNCVLTAEAVFDQSDADGLVELLAAEPPAELHGAVREAVAMCPARAIGVTGG
jgi:ferredoxin